MRVSTSTSRLLRAGGEKRIIPPMKKLMYLAIGAFCLSGCFSLDTAKIKATGEEHVLARNFGWRLFNWIPLACGNASPDASCPFVLFRDDVTVEKVQKRFAAYANGREVFDPTYSNRDSVFFDFFGWPIPYILCYKEVALSGTLRTEAVK